jgi:prevent-host-death family protein
MRGPSARFDHFGLNYQTMKTISVSELKARLSENLRVVKAGERLLVTERGRPIAVLGPAGAEDDDPIARLEAAGLVRVGTRRLPRGFWDMPRPKDPKGKVLRSLLREREEGW